MRYADGIEKKYADGISKTWHNDQCMLCITTLNLALLINWAKLFPLPHSGSTLLLLFESFQNERNQERCFRGNYHFTNKSVVIWWYYWWYLDNVPNLLIWDTDEFLSGQFYDTKIFNFSFQNMKPDQVLSSSTSNCIPKMKYQ